MRGKVIGVLFSLHPFFARKQKIKGNTSIALINLSTLENIESKNNSKYRAIPMYPPSIFDFTLELPKGTNIGEVIASAHKIKMNLMTDFKVVDSFPMNDDKGVYLTVRAAFMDLEKTLSKDNLASLRESLLIHFEKDGFRLKKEL